MSGLVARQRIIADPLNRTAGTRCLDPFEQRAGRRRRRVVVLLVGILLLSLADLAATLTHLTTVGMVELNPIASYIISTTKSAWSLAAYKLTTVAVCLALLYRLRNHVQGEIAAWAGLLILATLTVYWGEYTNQAASPEVIATYQSGAPHDNWLTLAD